jgi:protein-S-isoprenylcysteine O-methyltransferase Ste14
MNSSLYLWLADIESMLWRMVRGVFHFTFLRLPEWVYRTLLDVIGPAAIRLVRVIVVFCLWLAVVFGPVALTLKFEPPLWVRVIAAVWLVLAIAGSIWGRSRLAKRRSAAAQGTNNDPRPIAVLASVPSRR